MNRLKNFILLSIAFAGASFSAYAQKIDSVKFFTEDDIIEMSITTDIKALQSQKGTPVYLPGTATLNFSDKTSITEDIGVAPRGVFRRDYCKIPPMSLDFRRDPTSRLSSLGKLKLVLGCSSSSSDEELLLKEYVAYKLYNIVEQKSFRVRLLHVNYSDSKGKVKPFTQYAFLIEDDGAMARRNGCMKKTHGSYLTEATDRSTMTMVAIFQYMIGNTDWAVPNEHNIKLIFDKNKPNYPPYAVAYDFDYAGLVDASYAVPNEIIGTDNVRERVYRGFPRSMEEIQMVLDIYRAKKESIISYVKNFSLLSERTKKGMVSYLEEFFKMIQNKSEVQTAFIDNARKS